MIVDGRWGRSIVDADKIMPRRDRGAETGGREATRLEDPSVHKAETCLRGGRPDLAPAGPSFDCCSVLPCQRRTNAPVEVNRYNLCAMIVGYLFPMAALQSRLQRRRLAHSPHAENPKHYEAREEQLHADIGYTPGPVRRGELNRCLSCHVRARLSGRFAWVPRLAARLRSSQNSYRTVTAVDVTRTLYQISPRTSLKRTCTRWRSLSYARFRHY